MDIGFLKRVSITLKFLKVFFWFCFVCNWIFTGKRNLEGVNYTDCTQVFASQVSELGRSKVCGCYSIHLSCSPTSTHKICTTKLVLHWQINNETYAIIELKLDFPRLWYGYQKCIFVGFSNGYTSPSNCVEYWVQSSY